MNKTPIEIEGLKATRFKALQPLEVLSKGDAFVLLHVESGKWTRTNESGKAIIELCDGRRTVGQIIDAIALEYGLPPDVIEPNVLPFVDAAVTTQFLSSETNGKGTCHACELESNAPQTSRKIPNSIDVWIHVTGNCNLRCPFCIQGGQDKVTTGRELELSEWLDLFRVLKDVEEPKVVVSGGEPFLRKDIIELLKGCREILGDPLELVAITNGLGCAPEAYVQAAEYVTALQVSLDGHTAAIHDAVRGKGSFDRTMKMLNAISTSAHRRKLWLSFTPVQSNVHSMSHVLKLAFKLGASGLHVNKLMPGGSARDHLNSLQIDHETADAALNHMYLTYQRLIGRRESRLNYLRNDPIRLQLDVASEPAYCLTVPRARKRCGMASTLISVDPFGNVYPCPSLHVSDFAYGNIREESFWSVRDRALDALQGISVDHIPGCDSCKFRYLCGGGCRAKAYYTEKDLAVKDPTCEYQRFEDRIFTIRPFHMWSGKGLSDEAEQEYTRSQMRRDDRSN